MAASGAASISFPSGTSELVMTYRCDTCRVEMTETLKASAAAIESGPALMTGKRPQAAEVLRSVARRSGGLGARA